MLTGSAISQSIYFMRTASRRPRTGLSNNAIRARARSKKTWREKESESPVATPVGSLPTTTRWADDRSSNGSATPECPGVRLHNGTTYEGDSWHQPKGRTADRSRWQHTATSSSSHTKNTAEAYPPSKRNKQGNGVPDLESALELLRPHSIAPFKDAVSFHIELAKLHSSAAEHMAIQSGYNFDDFSTVCRDFNMPMCSNQQKWDKLVDMLNREGNGDKDHDQWNQEAERPARWTAKQSTNGDPWKTYINNRKAEDHAAEGDHWPSWKDEKAASEEQEQRGKQQEETKQSKPEISPSPEREKGSRRKSRKQQTQWNLRKGDDVPWPYTVEKAKGNSRWRRDTKETEMEYDYYVSCHATHSMDSNNNHIWTHDADANLRVFRCANEKCTRAAHTSLDMWGYCCCVCCNIDTARHWDERENKDVPAQKGPTHGKKCECLEFTRAMEDFTDESTTHIHGGDLDDASKPLYVEVE